MINTLSIFNLLFLVILSCGGSNTEEKALNVMQVEFRMPFTVNQPTLSIELAKELSEISGLTFSSTSNNLLTVNDEEGIVYVLNPLTGAIIDEIEFGKKDDYEGIASHDGYIYIVESNGNIKVIKEETKTKIIEYDDRLSSDNDVEGLCFDPKSGTLLIAAKGDSETEGNTKNVKSIFTMNINNGAVRKKAYIQLNLKEAYKLLSVQSKENGVMKKMSMSSRLKKNGPSGIAIDPQTNLIYLLSAESKTLTVLDHEGVVKTIFLLDKKLHPQPEGITFDDGGNLYISNEGKKGSATLYKYNRMN